MEQYNGRGGRTSCQRGRGKKMPWGGTTRVNPWQRAVVWEVKWGQGVVSPRWKIQTLGKVMDTMPLTRWETHSLHSQTMTSAAYTANLPNGHTTKSGTYPNCFFIGHQGNDTGNNYPGNKAFNSNLSLCYGKLYAKKNPALLQRKCLSFQSECEFDSPYPAQLVLHQVAGQRHW